MDFYGSRLATCSSDGSVKIFDVKDGNQTLIADLRGHEGPVWQVAWAHPMYNSQIASCSYDRRVIIWNESGNQWNKTYEYRNHSGSVNSVCWAPVDYGLILACASSDGCVSILTATNTGEWLEKKIDNAHNIGCNAISWAPSVPTSNIDGLMSAKEVVIAPKRFVTGGCDNVIVIWREENDQWIPETKLEGHLDWVRDVAWAPSFGIEKPLIASCSQDQSVMIWTNDGSSATWNSQVLNRFNDVVWHVSWSITGDILAVSCGDNKVSLWKRNVEGDWVCISDVGRGRRSSNSDQRNL